MTTVTPLKYLARINERALPATTDPDRELRYVDIGSVGRGKLVQQPEQIRFANAPSRARRLVRDGDTIVSTVRTYLRAVWPIRGAADDLVVSTGFAVLTPTKVDPRYFSWWVTSDTFIDEVVARSVGVSYPAINASELGDLRVRVPSPAEQRAIADYLDTETNHIDTLITKKRRLIELLDHRLVSFATYLVNGDDQSQQSGIPSIPYIPRRWRSLRNKVFMHEISERSGTGDEELLSVSHLTGVTPRSEKTVYMFKAESMVGYKLVQPGDLAVNTMWAWMGAAGVSRHHGIVSPSYGVYRIDQATVLPGYFDLLVRTPAYICEMTRYSRGVTSSRLRLYPDELLALRTPVPPIDEQARIVQRFEGESYKARSTIDALERQVELLAERRQAVITAAVTGELSVA